MVADTDFMADLFWVQTQDLFGQQVVVPTANNADFIVNAADNLSGTSSLINLRSRGLSARPFELVQNIQNEAEDKYRAKERSLVKELEDVEKKMQELQGQGTCQECCRFVAGTAGGNCQVSGPGPRNPPRTSPSTIEPSARYRQP